MKYLSFIHIGDIHYPETKSQLVVDHKDSGMSTPLVSHFVPYSLKKVSDEIRGLIESDESVKAVLFSGDLTSKGDLAGYEECLNYLNKAFNLKSKKIWNNKKLHVVPGNHDVIRSAIDPTGADLFKKFEPILSAWKKLSIHALEPNQVRTTNVSDKNSSACFFSVNTCIGCGEKRFLPEKIKDELHKLLEKYVSTGTTKDTFDLVGEQLDTPAILEDHIGVLEKEIKKLDRNTVPVVLGHHGILPQSITRVALYTELLNGGYARSALSNLQSTVLYCHGHIHLDPVEVVVEPKNESGGLVLVSAPAYVNGFNLIKLFFTDKGIPLGCEIVPYRSEDFGGIRKKNPIRVRLQLSHRAIAICSEEAVDMLRCLDVHPCRFKDVVKLVRSSLRRSLREKTIENALLELEWLGLIELRNRSDECKHWHVHRIGA